MFWLEEGVFFSQVGAGVVLLDYATSSGLRVLCHHLAALLYSLKGSMCVVFCLRKRVFEPAGRVCVLFLFYFDFCAIIERCDLRKFSRLFRFSGASFE